MKELNVKSYSEIALPHLSRIVEINEAVMKRLSTALVKDVKNDRALLVFGSGHSSMFAMELYHRAGGPSFVLPLFADYLLPSSGPPVVRVFERTPGAATLALNRVQPKAGEMIWIASQSGINGASVDLALEAKKRGLVPVAFTSVAHSSAVKSRHPSGKRLFEVCDEVVDLGGFVGDAAIEIAPGVKAGPLSSLGCLLLAQSIVITAMAELERSGVSCVYTSVNTPEGESKNKALEEKAMIRDYLLR